MAGTDRFAFSRFSEKRSYQVRLLRLMNGWLAHGYHSYEP